MEVEGYQINGIDDVLLYDNIDEIYCRCCFKIFSPSDNRVELNNEFLNAIRTLFMLPMTFKEGSNICGTCNDTVMNFWKFKNEIVDKQLKFSMMISSNEHKDITKIRNLSQQPMKVNQPIVHKPEEIFIKVEPSDNVLFNSIFKNKPVLEIKYEKELPQSATYTIDENQEANLPPPTKKRKILVKIHVPQKKLPLKTVVKSTGNQEVKQEEFFVIPRTPQKSRKCGTCGKMYLDLLSHRIKLHGYVYYFRCSGCDFKSTERRHVAKHIETVHTKPNNRSKYCSICGKNFNRIKTHIEKVHKGVKNYFCDLCDFSSYEKRSLEYHIQSRHLPKEIKCPQCDFWTINNYTLKRHILNRHKTISKKKQELVNCPHCNKVLKGAFVLSGHIKRIHERDLRFKCKSPDCSKVFFSLSEMQSHFENCHGQKNFICDICGSAYGSLWQLKAHQKMHANYDFICELCNAKFKKKVSLTFHINRMHVSDKNFKCDQPNCNTAFYYKTDLNQHVKGTHSGIRFDCEVPGCKSSLGRIDAYRTHLKTSHKELRTDEIDKFIKRYYKFNRCKN